MYMHMLTGLNAPLEIYLPKWDEKELAQIRRFMHISIIAMSIINISLISVVKRMSKAEISFENLP